MTSTLTLSTFSGAVAGGLVGGVAGGISARNAGGFGPQGLRGPAGPAGPAGPPGTGGMTPAYGQFSRQGSQTIVSGGVQKFIFVDTVKSVGVIPVAPSPNFEDISVTETGTYLVSYMANVDDTAFIAIFINNDWMQPSTSWQQVPETHNVVNGSIIVDLTSSDLISVRSPAGTFANIDSGTEGGTSITITVIRIA